MRLTSSLQYLTIACGIITVQTIKFNSSQTQARNNMVQSVISEPAHVDLRGTPHFYCRKIIWSREIVAVPCYKYELASQPATADAKKI